MHLHLPVEEIQHGIVQHCEKLQFEFLEWIVKWNFAQEPFLGKKIMGIGTM